MPRRFILINAIHNRFEILANTYIEAARDAFQHENPTGFLLRDVNLRLKYGCPTCRLAMPVGRWELCAHA